MTKYLAAQTCLLLLFSSSACVAASPVAHPIARPEEKQRKPEGRPGPASRPEQARLLARLPSPGGVDLAFSQDGGRLLTAGSDQAWVWDVKAFRPVVGPLRQDEGKLMTLACLAPDGKRVLTAAGDEAWLWDADSGKRLLVLKHGGAVACAAFSPRGDKVITGGTDRGARVWDASTGKQLLLLPHEHGARFAVFSPEDGRTILTIDDDARADGGILRAWDGGTGEELWGSLEDVVMGGPKRRWRRPAAFSPDGKRVAWIAWGALHVADARRGLQGPLDVPNAGDALWTTLDFSPDGRRLLIVPGVLILDATNNELTPAGPRLPTKEDEFATVSPGGGRILVASAARGESGVWDVATRRQILSVPSATDDDVPVVAYSPDGQHVAAGHARSGDTSVWKIPAETEPQP